jgi:hypothetical protein
MAPLGMRDRFVLYIDIDAVRRFERITEPCDPKQSWCTDSDEACAGLLSLPG